MNPFFGLFLILSFWAASTLGANQGYVQDVKSERQERFYEVFLFAQPPPQERPLHSVIFNSQLSKEFKEKYREKFGQIDTESISYQRTDFGRLDAYKPVRENEQKNSERRAFSEYMMKRLLEWHVDNYVKSEPTMRPIYEAKEKLQKVEVRVTRETKVEGRYDFAGNTLDVIMDNPYCEAKWTIAMDPDAFGPSSIQENRLILGRPLTTQLRVENRWTTKAGRAEIELIRSHTPRLTTSYSLSGAFKSSDQSGESRVGTGLAFSF